jgi:hypothetical protein
MSMPMCAGWIPEEAELSCHEHMACIMHGAWPNCKMFVCLLATSELLQQVIHTTLNSLLLAVGLCFP